MKQINFKEVNGKTIVRLRGGRATKVIKDKTKYSRKVKHKGAE